jgi:type IX secretion system PorP/SprF family membrane protein
MLLITHIRGVLIFILMLTIPVLTSAQKVPSRPLSNPVYSPIVINPAFVGSKDFTNISLTSKVLKSPENQLFNIHKRLTTADGNYSKFGVGTYLFQEQLDLSRNAGIAATGAYHISLDKASIHTLSVGTSLKGIMNIPEKGEEAPEDSAGNVFNPNIDFGIYYYGPSAFAGISVTSLLGTMETEEVTVDSDAYIPREYHLYGGYKFVISRSSSIVLEPSLLVSLDDSTLSEPHKHLTPYLKLYLDNFYIGTYYKSIDEVALFFQYQFPRLYTGVFLEFPRVGFLNDENIIFEVILGIKLVRGGDQLLQYRHW